MSWSVCDWDWYANPCPVDLETMRAVKSALGEGRNVLVADTDAYSREVKDEPLNPGYPKNTKAGSLIRCLAPDAPNDSAHQRINTYRGIYFPRSYYTRKTLVAPNRVKIIGIL